MLLEYLIFVAICAGLTAVLAARFNREPMLWFFGAGLFPVALLFLLAMGDGRDTVACPQCGDQALAEVPRCRHCGVLLKS
jgi:hypothetical protein